MERRPQTFSGARRLALRVNAFAGLLAAFALVVMLNYLAARHPYDWNFSTRRNPPLSAQSLRIIRGITNDVRMTLFFAPTRESEALAAMLERLLHEYSDANPNLHVRVLDPTRQPGDAELALAAWQLGALKDRNFVVLETGSGRPQVLFESELGDYATELVSEGPVNFNKEIKCGRELDLTSFEV